MKSTAVCTVCGADFYAAPSRLKAGGGKFCTIACRSKAWQGSGNARWQAEGNGVCAGCGKGFHRKPTHLAAATKTFCSDACRMAAFPGKVPTTCKVCRKKFELFPSLVVTTGNCCSLACAAKATSKKVTLSCAKCSKAFERKPSALLHGKGAGAFCSIECKAAWQSSTPLSSGGVNRMTARKGGKREDLDGRYFRSSWEANYARYLNFLLARGIIKSWRFEPDTFEFPVKRGSKFYTPDFWVEYPDDSTEYHEVKGYMDAASATKLKRMRIHYPKIRVKLIDSPVYYKLAQMYSGVIPNWEGTTRGRAA